ncbi:MAG: type II toxin-antitoxin system VapC family toxin [Candidatus Hermodarchaeia archaeon]|jgi:rRNA-processing protein FCF1
MSTIGTTVLLDTNFLLLPFQRRIDIFEEIPKLIDGSVTFLVLPQIQQELKWIELNGTEKEKRAARSSMKLMENYCIIAENVPPQIQELDADTALLRYAEKTGAYVATNDSDLRRELKKQGSRVIFLRKLAVLALSE